jgi:hypothetical protein
MSGRKSRKRLPDLVRDAVDSTASSAEEIHKSIASYPLDVLDRLEILETAVREVRRVQDQSIGAVYDLVRGVNREVTQLANEILGGSVGKPRARKPARKKAASKKAARPRAVEQAA